MTSRISRCWILLLASVSFGQISSQDTFPNKARERIKSDVAKAELIFVATVINVGSPPTFRSGGFMATQAVQYQIEEVIRGKLAEGTHTLEVQHVVIAGSQTGDPSPEANRLSREMFAPGSRLIVIAIRRRVVGKRQSWLCLDEEYGAIRATDSNIAAIKQLVSSMGDSAQLSQTRSREGHRDPLIRQVVEHPITTSSIMPLELEPKLYWFYDGLRRIRDRQIEETEVRGVFLDRGVRFFFRASLEELNHPPARTDGYKMAIERIIRYLAPGAFADTGETREELDELEKSLQTMTGLSFDGYEAWKVWFEMHGKNLQWSDEKQLMIDSAS